MSISNTFHRVVSLLICITLSVSLAPSIALATNDNNTESEVSSSLDSENSESGSSVGDSNKNESAGNEDEIANLNQRPDSSEIADATNKDNLLSDSNLMVQDILENEANNGRTSGNYSLSGSAQIQSYGWQSAVSTSLTEPITLGTTGQGKRLEAITLSIPGAESQGGVEYQVHTQTYGWMGWQSDGAMAGTEGQAKRLEAVQMKLTGTLADQYDIYYRAHVQTYGWLGWAKNGESAGSEGLAKRVESIQVVLMPKGSAPDDYDATQASFYEAMISGSAQIQSYGWQSAVSTSLTEPITLGTTGQGKRLEAITLSIPGAESQGGVEYQVHTQTYGWMGWQSDGAMAGTEGQAKRLEAVQMKLTGTLADQYDIYYRAHVSKIGWLGWAKNGESAGTVACGATVEAIQVALVVKGDPAPGDTNLASFDGSSLPISVNCQSLSAGNGNWSSVGQLQTAGTTGAKKALVGIGVSASSDQIAGSVSYSAHFAKTGWSSVVSSGVNLQSGSNAIQAISISLTGDLSKYFDIYYRAHVSGYGWMGWTKNGAYSGSSGLGMNMEAYQVAIVLKGAAAPGTTLNSYSDANGFLKSYLQNRQYIQMANSYSSKTNYLILVDRAAHKVIVFSGSQGNWSVRYNWSCVTGAPSTPTITGSYYTTGYKRPSLSTDSRAIYCTQIWGGYFFHSILASEGELGNSLSHGCIRLPYSAAQWIYNNVYAGTRVVIFN